MHKENEVWLKVTFDVIDDAREISHIHEFATKQRADMRYNSKVVPRDMKKSGLVLKQVVIPTQIRKFLPYYEDQYQISNTQNLELIIC